MTLPTTRFLYITLSFLLLSLTGINLKGNTDNNGKELFVQISGIVTAKTIPYVPFAYIKVKNSTKKCIAGPDGFYSIAVKSTDTVEFSAVGFKRVIVSVPNLFKGDLDISYYPKLTRDTIEFAPVIVTPFLTKEDFRKAFLDIRLSDPLYDNAMRNLSPEILARLYDEMEMDGQEQGKITLHNIASSNYYGGQQRNYFASGGGSGTPIPYSLLNPFAWSQFIKALKNGEFKKKKKKY